MLWLLSADCGEIVPEATQIAWERMHAIPHLLGHLSHLDCELKSSQVLFRCSVEALRFGVAQHKQVVFRSVTVGGMVEFSQVQSASYHVGSTVRLAI